MFKIPILIAWITETESKGTFIYKGLQREKVRSKNEHER